MGNVVPFGRGDDEASRENPAVRKALRLMKEALAILDRGGAGCTAIACNLSLAIDHAEEQPVPRDEIECQAMLDNLVQSPAGLFLAGKI